MNRQTSTKQKKAWPNKKTVESAEKTLIPKVILKSQVIFRLFPALEISGWSGNSQSAARLQDPVTQILLKA